MIVLTQYAFRKLRWFRENCHENSILGTKFTNPSFLEVSLMGISESEGNLSKIIDFRCVPQECTGGNTEPTDEGMAIFFEDMLEDEQISPLRCGRFWAHTHPGVGPQPSSTDLETWNKYFKDVDFACMYILADGANSCRVRYSTNIFGIQQKDMEVFVELERKDGDGNHMLISVETIFAVDKLFKEKENYTRCADIMVLGEYPKHYQLWMDELVKNVKKKTYTYQNTYQPPHTNGAGTTWVNGKPIGFSNQFLAEEERKRKEKERQRETEQKTPQKSVITTKGLIKLLVRNGKDNVNAFTHDGIDEIVKALGITRSSLYDAQKVIIMNENASDWQDLLTLETDYNFMVDGKNNIANMDKKKIEELCVELEVRRERLNQLINIYIDKVTLGVKK
jgi:hypothetical protein